MDGFLYIFTNKGFVRKVSMDYMEIEIDKKIGKNEFFTNFLKLENLGQILLSTSSGRVYLLDQSLNIIKKFETGW